MADSSPIQMVVFDLAGTTIEDPGAVNTCFRHSLEAVGLNADHRQVDAVMGIAKPKAIRILLEAHQRPDLLGRADEIHADFVSRMLRFYREDPNVRAVPGVEPLFAALHAQGVKVAVNTGFSREITQAILDRVAWPRIGLIDASIASDEVAHGRPAPDMIRALMQRLGVDDPATVAKVGDTPVDLDEGRNSGCGVVVGVTWGSHSQAQLAKHPHTHIVDTVESLAEVLVAPTS